MRGFLPYIVVSFIGLSLAACGGGGGGTPVTGSPTPAEPDTTPPAQAQSHPDPAVYNTAEYRANYGLDAMHTISAYAAGLSGEGITVGVIDSGIDLDNSEFEGRISSASIDITTGSRAQVEDVNGHGTAVAGIIGAAKNDVGTQGVAYDSTLLAVRSDRHTDGCTADCQYYDTDVTDAVNYAVDHGAKVINISFGGDGAPTPALQQAFIRAVNAGVVVVFAAGNDETDSPNEFASFAADPRVKGGMLIAGATDATNTLDETYSDKAGSAGGTRDVFVVAPGSDIRIVRLNNPCNCYIGSGTSFAAPHVVGAVALLMQEFPNLTGKEIVSILIETANRTGVFSDAATYGQGMIDLAAAIQPSGQLTVESASGGMVPASGSLMPSTAMGNSFDSVFQGALAFDRYQRAYSADLADKLAPAPTNFTLRAAIADMRYRSVSADLGTPDLRVGFAMDETARRTATTSLETHADSFTPRPDIRMRTAITPRLSFSLNSGSTAGPAASPVGGLALTARANDPASQISGWGERASAAYALFDGMEVGSSVFRARRDAGAGFDDLAQSGSSLFVRQQVTRHSGIGVEAGSMQEQGSVLGMSGTGVFDGFDGAVTRYLQVDGEIDFGHLLLSGAYMASRTHADLRGNSLFTGLSTLSADSWSLTVLDTHFAEYGHRFGLSVTQPLAVRSGVADLYLATGWADDAPQYETRHISLAAPARETSLELFHRFDTAYGVSVQSNFIYRRHPDNVGGATDEAAVFMQLAAPW